MSLTASLLSGCNIIGERRIKEKCKNNGLEKSNRSADTPFENLLHRLRFSQKQSTAGLLVLEDIRYPFYFLLTKREMLHLLSFPKLSGMRHLPILIFPKSSPSQMPLTSCPSISLLVLSLSSSLLREVGGGLANIR